MDAIQAVILGAIGSLIAAFIFELWRANLGWFPGPSTPPTRFREPEAEDDARGRNRKRFKMAIFNGFFYLYTFFLVYQALSLPLILRAMFSGEQIFLSDARVLGMLLPEVAITNSTFQLSLLFVAFVLYVILLFVINFVASLLAPAVDKFWPITIFVWRRLQGILFIFFAACIAVGSIWLFYPVTLKEALSNFLCVLAIGALFIAAGKR
jgi:uncharacterized membrane protein YeaQ/YmgE (transglycosylase-associated protein family)